MPHRVDPALNTMQLAPPQAVLDRAPAEPKPNELPPPNHSVLPFRQLRDGAIEPVRRPFYMSDMGNSRRIVHGNDGERSRRTGGALDVTNVQRK